MADATERRVNLSSHILPNSGTMIGICTGLIGLVKVLEGYIGPSNVDEYSGLIIPIFLASTLLSYFSIRYVRYPDFRAKCERLADIAFLMGLCLLSALSILFAYEIV